MPPRKPLVSSTLDASHRRQSARINSLAKSSHDFQSGTDADEEFNSNEFSHFMDDDLNDSGSKGRKRGRPTKKAMAVAGPSRGASSSSKRAKVGREKDDEDAVSPALTCLEEEEIDEDEKPKVTFIPLKKMRDAGGIDYQDDRLHKNTLLFLKDLKSNNKRSWLKSNDAEYRRSLQDWNNYVNTLMPKVMEADPTIPELPLKDVIFRVYRDIRFSNDPTPYKPYYSVAFSRTGRKGPYAKIYIHCEPGSCFVGGGLWQPDAQQLLRLRASIDARPQRWRRILMDDTFRTMFLPGAKTGDEKTCLKAFCKANESKALKTKPKGFEADHRDIELLKLRSFTVNKKVLDSSFTAENGQEQMIKIIRAMGGYISFLNHVVRPDGDSSSDEEDDG